MYCPSSNSRQHLEHRAKLQRPVFRIVHLLHLRLRDRHQILILHGLLDLFGEQRLQDFALDVVGKPPADQRHRSLARAKPWNARDARKLPRHAFDSLLHVLDGNFQLQFAPASSFSHGSLGVVDFAFDYFDGVTRAPTRLARAAISLQQHARSPAAHAKS